MRSVPVPTRRADAERNKAKILAVARAAFVESGEDPSMAEVARRAGVGMATLYRNFPNRLDLLEELYRKQVDAICAAAGTAEGEGPGAVLLSWLVQFHSAGAQKGPLATLLLSASGSDRSVLNESRARVIAAGQPLFDAAQRSGEIRGDVTLGRVLDAIVAVEQVEQVEQVEPAGRAAHPPTTMVDVLLSGLRCPSGRPPARP